MTLAVLGGTPAFAEPLHVGRPNLPDRAELHERLDAILDRRWLTNDGSEVRAFETELSAVTGAECLAVASGTLALEVTARALRLTGEVIVPGFTFVATAHALAWIGLTPVFADVAPDTHLIDPEAVRAAITPRTSAIVGVHLWGRPCDDAALRAIADEHGLALLYDAAHSLPGAAPVGDAAALSFHATKTMNAFEGGAVVTRDPEVAARVRALRNFGFAGYDEVTELGTNAKLSEIAAAMGRGSLAALPGFVAANAANAARYEAGLEDISGVRLSDTPPQYVVCEVDAEAGLTRDELVDVLWAEHVLARRYFTPGVHRMEPYRMRDPEARLPVTERLAQRVMALPTGTALTPGDAGRICDLIARAQAAAPEVRAALSAARA